MNTMRNEMSARSIQLKPGLFKKQSDSKKTLIPSFRTMRNQSEQMRNVQSEQKLPTLAPSGVRKQTFLGRGGTFLPTMKSSMTKSKMSLGDPTLNRIYSNPQFQMLNQAPYMRPKTSAFGYPGGDVTKKDPTKKAPWTSEEVNSITGVKVRLHLIIFKSEIS